MYLSLISNAAIVSLHYIVEARDKNGLKWHHRLIIFHAYRSFFYVRNPWTVHCYMAIYGQNISS